MKRTCSGVYCTFILMVFTAFLVAGCGTSSSDSTDGGVSTGTAAASLSLSLTQTSVLSDNSDSSTVTATVLDAGPAPLMGVTVSFTASSGVISASSGVTDENGQVIIEFSSGTLSRENGVATIEASVAGLETKQIPIQITGTTVTLSSGTSNLEVPGAASDTLTIAVRDASLVGIFDAPVTVSIDAASTGAALFSLPDGTISNVTTLTANTDVSGELDVTVTATGAGSLIVSVASQGATASKTYTVATTGSAFSITSPATDPYALATATNLTITVNAPSQSQVLFVSTFGYWDGNPALSSTTKGVVGGTASAVLRSDSSGTATVQVSDPGNPATLDTLRVAIAAPSSEAFQISLQASAQVVARSTGAIQNTVTLSATVKNSSDQVVGNSPVLFSIVNPTGGGETISPALSFTDSSGIATATFTSGSLSSNAAGVTVSATVLGTAITDDLAIVIGGTATSLTIGQSTTMTSVYSNTAYQLPMSVSVSDSNNNPISGATVTLKAWPSQFITGVWSDDNTPVPLIDGTFPNEDVNRNNALDAGDTDQNLDGILQPPQSAAGILPSTVTTDENGVAEFNLIYVKASAAWIETEITASTLVLGTETQSRYTKVLPYIISDADNLPDSPYNPYP